MLDKLIAYLPLLLAIIGAASVAAKALKPAVEMTKNKWDNKIVAAIVKVADFILKALDGVALNPKVPDAKVNK